VSGIQFTCGSVGHFTRKRYCSFFWKCATSLRWSQVYEYSSLCGNIDKDSLHEDSFKESSSKSVQVTSWHQETRDPQQTHCLQASPFQALPRFIFSRRLLLATKHPQSTRNPFTTSEIRGQVNPAFSTPASILLDRKCFSVFRVFSRERLSLSGMNRLHLFLENNS
jgi:hypothetical protein